MSTTLDPRIAAKLDAFAHRRRRLILFRGLCAAVAMLLGAMMVVALIDWVFVLPDQVRWGLSIAAYLAVLIVAWRACGRLLLQVPDSRSLARLIENAEPALREELLSAVELGQGTGEWDSEQFRALVQADVSNRVAGLEMDRLLPAVLIRTAGVALTIMVVLCLVALVVPSLRFGALLMRALAPGANLDRVSSVHVRFIQPAPQELAVPQGDSVPLLVELTGRRVTTAYLETFTKSGGRAIVQLQPAPGGRFSAGIQVAREDVEYRVRAFDAITRKYRLEAAARPAVTGFHKEYHYPAYTKLPAKTADEESGDLAGVEGTEVELAVQTNQPVKTAVITVEAGHKTLEIPLEHRADGQLTAKIPLKTAGVYRIELVSEKTGFENKFNPEYELRVNPDTIPQITLQTPERDLIASSNEVIGFTATASDDIAVVKVEQQYKINDGKWASRTLSQQRATEVKVDERWDLFKQGVHPGDSIVTKLVAVDCKGNRGESRPVSITVAASGFDRARLDALAAEKELLKDVQTWQASTVVLEQKYAALRKLLESNPAGDLAQRKAALADFGPALEHSSSLAAAAQAQLVTTIRAATPGHETANLVLLSRSLSQGEVLLTLLPKQIQAVAQDPLPDFSRELSRLASESLGVLLRRSKLASDDFGKLVTAEELDIVNENLQVVVREQSRLAVLAQASGDDAAKWAPIAGRMKVVLAEVASTEEGMKAAAAGSDLWRDRIARLQKRLGDLRGEATNVLNAPVPGKALLGPAVNLARAASEVTQQMLELKRDHSQSVLAVLQGLQDSVEPGWYGFEKLKKEVEDIVRLEKFSVELRGDLAGGQWDARANLWKAYGDAEELRPDADAPFVKDVRSLRLAIDGVREQLVTPGLPTEREPGWKRMAALDQAFRILETAHDLTQLANGFELLAVSERYQAGGLRAKTSSVTDHLRLWQRLLAADNEVNRTNLLNPAVRKLTLDARQMLSRIPNDQAARTLDEEMRQRMRVDREPTLVPVQTERVAMLVRAAAAVLKPAVDEARGVIAAAAPKLQERLAQLAKEAKELQQNNAEKAADKSEKPPEQARAEARQNLAQQEKLNEKVEAVKDAIRAEANLQNVLEKEGREKARDADDALAMLKDPPPRAEQALNDAAKAERPAEQKDALKAAANEDKKLADALDKLAQHFEALEKGDAEKTRLALREEEKNLGVKDDLDQQYAKTADLAKTAEASPQGMLDKLEKALPNNPLMRQELSNVTKDLLDKANTQLAAATKQESAVAREIEKMAAAQPKPAPGAPQPAANPPAKGEKPPGEAQPQPNGEKPGEAKPQTDGAKPPGEANGEKPPGDAQPKANGDKPPGDAQAPADSEKPAGANSPANGEKPPAGSTAVAKADQPPGEAKPQANGEKPPSEATPPANGEKPPANQVANADQPLGATPPAAPKPAPNPGLARAAEQQKPIAKNAAEAGDAVERAGRHEERLKNDKVGEDLQKLGADVKATAQTQVPKAEQALTKADAAADAKEAVGAAETDLKKQLARLGDAQNGQPPATPPAGAQPDAPKPPDGAPQPGDAPKPGDVAKQDAPPADAGAKPPGQTPDGQTPPATAAAGTPPAGAKPPGQTPAGQTPPATAAAGRPSAAPGQPPAGQAPPATAAAGAKPPGQTPAGENPPATADAGTPPAGEDPLATFAANTPATPQQQVWMARALDALDAALHANPAGQQPDGAKGDPQAGDPQKGDAQNGQPKPGQGQQPAPGSPQPGSDAAQQAQKAMAAAAQAAAAEMRANRSPTPPGEPGAETAKGGQLAASKTGAKADANGSSYGKLAGNTPSTPGNWGKLPKQMAEQLTQGSREAVSAEYQKEVETYYRVIAERARKNAK